MGRDIKFRGLTEKGEWKYGNLLNEQTIGEVGNNLSHYKFVTVNPETVGQFTGLKDNNGVEIYENDLVKAKDWNPSVFKIEFIEGGFCGTYEGNLMPTDINHFYDSTGCHIEIIGNIHENSDLLTP